MSRPDTRGLIWLAWRVEDDGGVVTVATLRRGDDYERERWTFDSLESAVDVLGESFEEVARRVLETGRRAGRWRP